MAKVGKTTGVDKKAGRMNILFSRNYEALF